MKGFCLNHSFFLAKTKVTFSRGNDVASNIYIFLKKSPLYIIFHGCSCVSSVPSIACACTSHSFFLPFPSCAKSRYAEIGFPPFHPHPYLLTSPGYFRFPFLSSLSFLYGKSPDVLPWNFQESIPATKEGVFFCTFHLLLTRILNSRTLPPPHSFVNLVYNLGESGGREEELKT